MGLHGLIPTLIYVAGIAAFLASAFWRAEVGIYYIVPLLPLQTTRYKLHEFPLGHQWIDLMLLGVVIGLVRQGDSIFTQTPLRKWLAALAALTYLSLWRGTFFLNTSLPLWFDDVRLSDWKNYMVIFILFFLTLASIKSVKQMQILLVCMCFALLVINRSYINTMRQRDFSAFSYDLRDDGGMGYAGVNGLAALEAQASAFVLGLYSMSKRKALKVGYLLVLGTCLVTLTYTLSRGGYAAALIAAFFVGAVRNRKLLIVLSVFLLTWQTIVPNAVRERVFMTQDSRGQLDPSAGDRVTLWENAVEIFKANPAIGTGFDTYKFLHAVGPYEDTHNYYVKVLVEMGVLGLVILLGVLMRIFIAGYALFRNKGNEDFVRGIGLGLAGMLIATAVANAFGDRWTYIEETGFMWTIAAMAIRAKLIPRPQANIESAVDASPLDHSLEVTNRALLDYNPHAYQCL